MYLFCLTVTTNSCLQPRKLLSYHLEEHDYIPNAICNLSVVNITVDVIRMEHTTDLKNATLNMVSDQKHNFPTVLTTFYSCHFMLLYFCARHNFTVSL